MGGGTYGWLGGFSEKPRTHRIKSTDLKKMLFWSHSAQQTCLLRLGAC